MGSIWTNSDGLRVQFGTRKAGDEGNFGEAAAPSGVDKVLAVTILASDFTVNTATYNGPTVSLPAGVTIKSVAAEVITAFAAMGGTTPTMNVGVSGSVSTNRAAQLSNAQVQAVAPLDLTSTAAGTLAASTPLTAAATVTIGLGGTTPTVTSAVGKIVVYIRYADPNAVTS